MIAREWPKIVGVRADALPAWATLQRKLQQVDRTPCTDEPELWHSDDPAERDLAARACCDCLLIDACSQFAEANHETAGVWGGLNYTPTAGRPAQRRESA